MCPFEVDKRAVEARHGIVFDDYFAPESAALGSLEAEGFLHTNAHTIRAGGLGRLFPRNVAMVFDRYLRRKAEAAPRFSRTV